MSPASAFALFLMAAVGVVSCFVVLELAEKHGARSWPVYAALAWVALWLFPPLARLWIMGVFG